MAANNTIERYSHMVKKPQPIRLWTWRVALVTA